MQIDPFRRRLLAWFAANKRAMPWRGTRDAYRVWVSEVMLQQTRVAAVARYYRRFMRRFPTVDALARARESEVLKYWAGLGYYSRARNLHRAAREIIATHGGRYPRALEAALALPGVGGYTAAAVLSIAYDQPHAALDGNVARVLARLFAVRGELRAPRRWRKLQRLADRLLAHQKGKGAQPSVAVLPGEWNQAMMEFGATVCTPRAPRCDACPVAQWCRAHRLGIAEALPAGRRKRAAVGVSLAAAVLLDKRGRTVLLAPNGDAHDGIFSRMWQFPVAPGGKGARAKLCLQLTELNNDQSQDENESERLTPRAQRITEGTETDFVALPPVKHAVTFRAVTLHPFLLRVAELPRMAGARRPRLGEVETLAVSSATRKIARRAIEFLSAMQAGKLN